MIIRMELATLNGTRLTDNGTVTLDSRVVKHDKFTWSDPSNSPFNWFITGEPNETVLLNPSNGTLTHIPTDNTVSIASNYRITLDTHPAWKVDFVASATTETTQNAQELLLIDSPKWAGKYVNSADETEYRGRRRGADRQ